MKINIIIKCLFLDAVGPIIHQALQEKSHCIILRYRAVFNLSAWPGVVGPTTFNNKH